MMISDGSFAEYECSISDDKHFIKEPIILPSCGHSVCRSCLPKDLSNATIKCKLCGEITNRDLSNDKEAVSIKIAFKRNLEMLFNVIEKQTCTQLLRLKSCVEGQTDRIEQRIKYIQEEIDIRIESIKNEIENLGDQLKKELDEIKIDLLNSNESHLEERQKNIGEFEVLLDKLQSDIKDKFNKNEASFYEYQESLMKLNKIVQELEIGNYEIDLKISENSIKKSLVGRISYKNFKRDSFLNTNFKDSIRSEQFKVHEIDFRPFDSIVLSNDFVLYANRDDKKLTICDQNFKAVRTIDKFEEKTFYPEAIAYDSVQHIIYFTNRDSHEIVMTNLDFKRIKSFGSYGNDTQSQLNDPCGICFINDLLYVCDSKNKRILILDSDLEFQNSIKLQYEPWLIKASNDLACIERNDGKGIDFYDLNNNFTFKFNYNHGWGKISMINSCFYECCAKTKKLYCYDEKGALIEEINVDRFDRFISNSWDGYLFCFQQKLLMLCYNKRKIIEFI